MFSHLVLMEIPVHDKWILLYHSTHRGDLCRMKVSQQLLKAWGNQAGCEMLSTLGPTFPAGFKQKRNLKLT